jgi:hypothetical protein
MGLGVFNNSGLGVSEVIVGTLPKLIISVPTNYCKEQGQMDFIKRSSGDIVYIGLCGKAVSPVNYDIVLTDAVPFYNLNGLALGDVRAVGTTAASALSATVFACT